MGSGLLVNSDQHFGGSHLSVDERRARGAYYTPGGAAQYMARWISRGTGPRILEPSAGDGIFLRALDEVAATDGRVLHVQAVELDPVAYNGIKNHRYEHIEVDASLNDFMRYEPQVVDAVIGNPPFVRVRNLSADGRATAMRCASHYLDEPMDPAASTWMPFLLHASNALVVGGRLGFVLPYEMTYVRYGFPLWEFLRKNFGDLRVVRVRERIFPGLLQEVVLLLASDRGNSTERVSFEVYESLLDLQAERPMISMRIPVGEISTGRPFVAALIGSDAQHIWQRLRTHSVPAGRLAKFRIGYVSGDKKFFQPGANEIAEFGLDESSLRPAVANARALRGNGLWTSALSAASALFAPDPSRLSAADLRYIRQGEATGVNNRYKCRIRDPWYIVPGVKEPEAILTVFSSTPLLMLNDDKRVASNSLLCVYLQEGVSPESFAASWYTSVTLLSIEEQVHALGGGVFVLVPREAARIRLLDRGVTPSLQTEEVNNRLKDGDIFGAYRAGDSALLASGLLDPDELSLLQNATVELSRWRTST